MSDTHTWEQMPTPELVEGIDKTREKRASSNLEETGQDSIHANNARVMTRGIDPDVLDFQLASIWDLCSAKINHGQNV